MYQKCDKGKSFAYLNPNISEKFVKFIFLYISSDWTSLHYFGNNTYGVYCLEIVKGIGKLAFNLNELLGVV